MSGKYPPMNRNNRYNNNNSNNGNNTNKYRNDDSNRGTGPGTGTGHSFANNYDNGNGNGNGNRYDNRRQNRNNVRNDNGYNVNEYQNSGLNINRNEVISNPNSENVVDAATNGTNTSVIDNYTPKEFDKWEDLENVISENLMRGIYAYGFDSPSLIQRKALLIRYGQNGCVYNRCIAESKYGNK